MIKLQVTTFSIKCQDRYIFIPVIAKYLPDIIHKAITMWDIRLWKYMYEVTILMNKSVKIAKF